MSKKIMAAMSGGVDSSVTALLLQEQGHELCGATLKLFADEESDCDGGLSLCGSKKDAEDAREVCRRLGIEHYVFDFGAPFRQQVIERFAHCYICGQTPNPCIECNRHIKFGGLCAKAAAMGFDNIATGHYARIEFDEKRGRWLLKKARDPHKDQSYVLYTLSQPELAMTLFPLGELTKSEVRAKADAHGFANAAKPDSQDICFVKDGDYGAFITGVLGLSSPPGDFIDSGGQVLGQHRGLIHYTIGQRKGLGISFGRPRYVVALDAKENTVTLGDEQDLYRDSLIAESVNFISIPSLEGPLNVSVKTRYKQKEVAAQISPLADGRVKICFEQPQRAITPGQAAVFYEGETVVGGGTIC